MGVGATQSIKSPSINGFYEYLLVAYPDKSLYTQIMEGISQMPDLANLKSRMSFTIAGFEAKEAMESTIIRWMHRIISSQNSFPVKLTPYRGPSGQTIYLQAKQPAAFEQLAREMQVVDQYLQSNNCPALFVNKNPQLVIARDLPDPHYQDAMPQLEKQGMPVSFIVHELVLLRRQHRFDACKQVNVFGLRP
jgi:hypothetical protein